MENLSMQRYVLVGARQFQGGLINGQMVPPSCKVIAALPMDESTGNSKGMSMVTFRCTGLEVYAKVSKLQLPCVADFHLLQVAATDGRLNQIVHDVDLVQRIPMPDMSQSSEPVVQHKKAS